MPAPDGAQLSPDGNYWWDGNDWQSVDQSPDTNYSSSEAQVGQLSEDGNYSWDGAQWQPVAANSDAAAGDESAAAGTVEIDLSEVPALARIIEYANLDIDSYLASLGIETSLYNDDEEVVS